MRFKSVVDASKWSATISGWFVKPKGPGPFPTVIFLHACAGITPAAKESLNAHANYMKKHGFASFILDSFGARKLQGGKICKGTPLTRLAYEFRVDDAFNAMKTIRSKKFVSKDNIFLVGQSHGGGSAILAAMVDRNRHSDAFRAIAAYYPRCYFFWPKNELKSPLIIFGGGKDNWAPFAACQDAEKRGRTVGAEYKAILYPSALHGFDLLRKSLRSGPHLMGRDRSATADSRNRMRDFFRKHMTGSLKSKRRKR